LINELDIRGNLITDAQLAALAIEHGVPVVSVNSDFVRFSDIRWVNPILV
jgi:predicted nucleic acid-binding protein